MYRKCQIQILLQSYKVIILSYQINNRLIFINIHCLKTINMSTSAFKNRIPKRKYRERVQPEGRQHLGFLQKKKDYKIRAKNYHARQDMINNLKLKASTKNEDQFYFKMLKGKKNENGVHVQEDEDSDFDQKQYRVALKTQNYSLVNNQRSIVQKKIQKMRAVLQLISEKKPNTHKIFVDNSQQLNQFEASNYFKTSTDLIENNMLQINPNQIKRESIIYNGNSQTLKNKYNKLSQYIKKEEMLTKMLLKLGYQKNLLGKQRKMIKKNKKNGTKIHKFFMQRKK